MHFERRARPGGSLPHPSGRTISARATSGRTTSGRARSGRTRPVPALAPVLLAALASCAGLSDVLPRSSADRARAAPAPEDAARHRRLAPGRIEAFRLPNGLAVVLLEDRAGSRVVVDTWIDVGARDEAPGRSGLAHLVLARPTGARDGAAGGRRDEHASVGADRTRATATGPAELLPELLRLEAARLAALGEPPGRDELERRRALRLARPAAERGPRDALDVLLPPALYPEGHPYHDPVIGRDADVGAASAEDVAAFVRERCGAANASLVVAGDFDPRDARELVERAFGSLEARPAPARRRVPPVELAEERSLVVSEPAAFPRLVLAWHSPPAFAPGDAELDLLATILAEGASSRLERRLVLDLRLARGVEAAQLSADLGSVFVVEVHAAIGADLDAIERVVLGELEALAREGPGADELARARVRAEARFRRRMESLLARAEAVQAYRRAFGEPDGFGRDLARWTEATSEAVRDAVRSTFGPGRVDLRVLPEADAVPGDSMLIAPRAARGGSGS